MLAGQSPLTASAQRYGFTPYSLFIASVDDFEIKRSKTTPWHIVLYKGSPYLAWMKKPEKVLTALKRGILCLEGYGSAKNTNFYPGIGKV